MSELPVDTLIPAGATINAILDRYELHEKIRCGKTDCRTLHNIGVVVSFTYEGVKQSGVIGNDCATKVFGDAYAKAEQTFDAVQRDLGDTEAVKRFHTRADRILPELEAALPHLRWQANMFSTLNKGEPRLVFLCLRAVKSEQEKLTLGRTPLHHVQGELTFWDGYRGAQRAEKLHSDVTELQNYLTSGKLTSKGLKKRLPDVIDIEHRWNIIQKSMVTAEAALSPEHMIKLLTAVNSIISAKESYEILGQQTWTLRARMTGTILEILTWKWDGKPGEIWKAISDLSTKSYI